MTVHETDICIIGGGITSAMLAERLSELRPGIRIIVVEAGRSIFDTRNRGRYRERAMQYGEHPWPEDYIEDQQADGIISLTMAVGGLALHWGGACNRFSQEHVLKEHAARRDVSGGGRDDRCSPSHHSLAKICV
jgi:quinoprotein glucose dehydrogenase